MLCRASTIALAIVAPLSAASSEECAIRATDPIVLLRGDSAAGPVAYCIYRGHPTVISTLDGEGKRVLTSRYEGMQGLETDNYAAGAHLTYVYTDLVGDPTLVRPGQVVQYRLDTQGAAVSPLAVEMRGVEETERTISGCRFVALSVKRINRPLFAGRPTAAAVSLDIVFAPELGWSIESIVTLPSGQKSVLGRISAVARRAEAETVCGPHV